MAKIEDRETAVRYAQHIDGQLFSMSPITPMETEQLRVAIRDLCKWVMEENGGTRGKLIQFHDQILVDANKIIEIGEAPIGEFTIGGAAKAIDKMSSLGYTLAKNVAAIEYGEDRPLTPPPPPPLLTGTG